MNKINESNNAIIINANNEQLQVFSENAQLFDAKMNVMIHDITKQIMGNIFPDCFESPKINCKKLNDNYVVTPLKDLSKADNRTIQLFKKVIPKITEALEAQYPRMLLTINMGGNQVGVSDLGKNFVNAVSFPHIVKLRDVLDAVDTKIVDQTEEPVKLSENAEIFKKYSIELYELIGNEINELHNNFIDFDNKDDLVGLLKLNVQALNDRFIKLNKPELSTLDDRTRQFFIKMLPLMYDELIKGNPKFMFKIAHIDGLSQNVVTIMFFKHVKNFVEKLDAVELKNPEDGKIVDQVIG